MAVARLTEIVASSNKSFEDATQNGFARATRTLRNITGFRVIEWKAKVTNDKIAEFRVTLQITFLLEDTL